MASRTRLAVSFGAGTLPESCGASVVGAVDPRDAGASPPAVNALTIMPAASRAQNRGECSHRFGIRDSNSLAPPAASIVGYAGIR